MKEFRKQVCWDITFPTCGTTHSPDSCLTWIRQFLTTFFRYVRKAVQKTDSANQAKRHHKSYSESHHLGWAPLIKTLLSSHDTQPHYPTINTGKYLSGKTVLCIGGREHFYDDYRTIIQHAGGSLLTFRGDKDNHLAQLSRYLEAADLIICPIDHVNHDAYQLVKCYCKFSCKHCVLLDRSHIHTFRHGIALLASKAGLT